MKSIEHSLSEFSELQSAALTFNPHCSQNVLEQRERLPIRKQRLKILHCVEKHNILVLCGEAGTGKGTQLPQFLYQCSWHLKGIIGVTEPRQLAASHLGERVAAEMGETLGRNVEVVVKMSPELSAKTSAIKFMTEEVLLQEMFNDPLLTRYSVLIVDEAHERSAKTDLLLGLLKKILKKRLNLKLIICCDTANADFFKDFFTFKKSTTATAPSPSCVLLSLPSCLHAVKIFHLDNPCSNYVKETVEKCWKIHKNKPHGDILAFLTGQEEVLEAIRLLKEYIASDALNDVEVVALFNLKARAEQLNIFGQASRTVRKIFFAIGLAEAPITMSGVAYVVDCGFDKLRWYNSTDTTNNLAVVPVSKAVALQRSKRAGIERAGEAYRLYSEEQFNALAEQTVPEMRRIDLTSIVIFLKALGVDNVLWFNFPSPPPARNLLTAVEILYALEALSENGKLTRPLGYFLAELPLNPMLGKMLYVSGQLGCSVEIITIIAMLQAQQLFAKPVTGVGQIKARVAKRNFEVAEGDLLTLLNVYTAYAESGRTKEFCGRYYLSYRSLRRVDELREQLVDMATKKLGIPLLSCNGETDLLGKCITAGLFPNTAYLHHSGEYRTIRGNKELTVHPLSALRTLPRSKFVVYVEILQTTKPFMKDITVVQESWLSEFASQYYQKKTIR